MGEKDAAGEPTPGRSDQPAPGVDYSRYRMNPVDIEESAEIKRALPRRIAVYFVAMALVVVAVIVIIFWNQRTAHGPPLESLDPDVRAQARELVDNILTRVKSLQGIVYDVQYPSPITLRIYISPAVSEGPGVEHSVTPEEIERATNRVTEEFSRYGRSDSKLEVQAFVVEDPDEAIDTKPAAIGTYDPEAKSTSVRLTAEIPLPSGTGTGTALPGEGHIGEHGGIGMPAEPGR